MTLSSRAERALRTSADHFQIVIDGTPTAAELKAQLAARNAVIASEAMSAADALPSDEAADDLAAKGAGEAVSSDDDAPPTESDGAMDTPHPKIVVFPRATAAPAVASAEPPAADGTPALW